jgi:hypothetical protein
MRIFRNRSAVRCEDCGRKPLFGTMHHVEWDWFDGKRHHVTWLCLCSRCARVMARAFAGDRSSRLIFHPA